MYTHIYIFRIKIYSIHTYLYNKDIYVYTHIHIYIFKSFVGIYCLFPTWTILSSATVFRLIESCVVCFPTKACWLPSSPQTFLMRIVMFICGLMLWVWQILFLNARLFDFVISLVLNIYNYCVIINKNI